MTGPARYTLTRTFSVDVTARPGGHPTGTPGARPTDPVRVRIRVGSDTLVYPGSVVDFAALDPLQAHLDQALDHYARGCVRSALASDPGRLARMLADWASANLQTAFPAGVRVLDMAVSQAPSPWTVYEVPR